MVLVQERTAGIVTLTLHRPEKLNALSWELLHALEDAVRACAADPAVRCVLLTGAGERAFSAGADLEAVAALTPESAREWIRLGHRICNGLVSLPQPVIAALRGYCLGGGLELAVACDFRIAAEDARLGLPEVSRGWTPGWGGARRLATLVGPARARQLALVAEPVSAQVAEAWGLVHRVVPPERLLSEATALAQRLAGFAPAAVREVKAALQVPGLVLDEAAIEADAATLAAFVADPQLREAIEAFLQRRRRPSQE
jgi:enoyl-CoA hydratase